MQLARVDMVLEIFWHREAVKPQVCFARLQLLRRASYKLQADCVDCRPPFARAPVLGDIQILQFEKMLYARLIERRYGMGKLQLFGDG